MIEAYNEILGITKDELLKLNFKLKINSDYTAEFSNNSQWQVILEGDKFIHPAFDIFIARDRNTNNEKRFSIRILMLAFGDSRPPSLHNQLDFFANNQQSLLTKTNISYETAYKAINEQY